MVLWTSAKDMATGFSFCVSLRTARLKMGYGRTSRSQRQGVEVNSEGFSDECQNTALDSSRVCPGLH